jgi:hypothetical protein
MDTFENGQSIGEGELRSRVPRHESAKRDTKANGQTTEVQQAKKVYEEDSKDLDRVQKTFGRTPDGTGTHEAEVNLNNL